MTDQSSIRSILSTLETKLDDDAAFIIAAGINLYAESLRRITGKVLFSPQDARNVVTMVNLLIMEKPEDFAPRTSRSLTKREEEDLAQAIEQEARRV